MLQNGYLSFANSIMQKYGGMVSRINPLALVFLQNEEEEDPPSATLVRITNVNHYHYRTNRFFYQNVANRYIQNYNQILTLLRSNSLYQNNLNFKTNIQDVTNRTTLRTDAQVVNKGAHFQTNVNTASNTTLFRSDVHPVSLQHNTVNAEEKTEHITERIIEQLLREKVNVEENTFTDKVRTIVMETLQPSVMSAAPGISRSIINREMEKVWEKSEIKDRLIQQLHEVVHTEEKFDAGTVSHEITKEQDTVKNREIVEKHNTLDNRKVVAIQHLIRDLVEHFTQQTDICTKGKERYERQIANRLMPLSVNPMHLQYAKENSEIPENMQDGGKETIKEGIKESIKESVSKEIQKSIQKNIKEATKESIRESIRENTKESIKESIQKNTKESIQKNVKETVQKEVKEKIEQTLLKEEQLFQQRVVSVIKKGNTVENRYHMHPIDIFLQNIKKQETKIVDRSLLPAGIIYYKKPEKTVEFYSRDVIRLPYSMPQRQEHTELIHRIEVKEEQDTVHTQRRIVYRDLPPQSFTYPLQTIEMPAQTITLRGQEMSPVVLIHRSEEVKSPESSQESSLQAQSEIPKPVQQDIVFTKNVVTRQNQENVVTENISVKTKELIEESVSRHMDDNIQEISKKIYKDLHRQIKKEQQRRGI